MSLSVETQGNPASLAEAALAYASMGLKVIPLHSRAKQGGCTCPKGAECKSVGKHPRIASWQTAASSDEAVVGEWWERWPEANVGGLLGEQNGIIDIECDSPEAEQELLDLFDGDPPVCPTFQSRRGKHRIFKWRGDLPGAACIHIGKVEVRTGNDGQGAQSVFPPSLSAEGVPRVWLVPPEVVEPPALPDAVVAKMWNLQGEEVAAKRDWPTTIAPKTEGSRNSDLASCIGGALHDLSDDALDNQSSIDRTLANALAVNDRNLPPLPDSEVRQIFTSLLKKERNRRTEAEITAGMIKPPEMQTGQQPTTGEFKLVIYKSDPPQYRLYHPYFVKATGGHLTLTAAEMNSAPKIRIKALEQADYGLPNDFNKLWSKRGGFYERVVASAEVKEAPLEQRRPLVVASRFKDCVASPKILEEGEKPAINGRPAVLPEGDLIFVFEAVWGEMLASNDKVTRLEFSQLLEELGVRWRKFGQKRFKSLSPVAVAKLDAMLTAGEHRGAHGAPI